MSQIPAINTHLKFTISLCRVTFSKESSLTTMIVQGLAILLYYAVLNFGCVAGCFSDSEPSFCVALASLGFGTARDELRSRNAKMKKINSANKDQHCRVCQPHMDPQNPLNWMQTLRFFTFLLLDALRMQICELLLTPRQEFEHANWSKSAGNIKHPTVNQAITHKKTSLPNICTWQKDAKGN